MGRLIQLMNSKRRSKRGIFRGHREELVGLSK